MECWKILHIEPTQDKQAIKEAYMDKLSLFHPEEDPEGFKRLRQAYETALQEADKLLEGEAEDDSPSGIWLQKVKEVYKCFSKRIDVSYWEELLEDDVCYQLDMAEETGDKLLNFLMDNYRLPQPVWALLCDRFNWFEKKEELLKKYPEGFINFVFDESTYDYENAIIKYELFEGFDEADYDEWFRKFFDLRRAVNERNNEEAEKILSEVSELEIYHPEMECLKVRYLVQINKLDEAREIINAVLEKYPDNASYLYSAGQIELFAENTALAREFYEKALKINPNHIGACEGIGECCFIEKDYENAEEYYMKVGNEYPYDEYVSSRIYDIKDNLAKQCLQRITDGEKDNKLLFKTAWLNFEIRNYEKAKEIFEMINPQKEEMEQYYDLEGRIFSELKDYQRAVKSFEKMLDIAQEENTRAYVYKQLGIQYYALKDYEKAVNYYDKALEHEKDNVDLYNRKAVALFWQKKYDESIAACDSGLEIDNRIAHLHVNKAKALYEIGNYSQAMDECEMTNSIYPYFKDAYLIELKIFGEVGDFQRALEVVKQIDKLEIRQWELEQYKGKVYNSLNDYENAEKSYLKALELNGENDCILYDLAQTLNNKGDYEEALKNIEKSIKLQKEPYKYMLKGLIHKNMKQKPQAIRCYNYCIKMNYNPDYAENNKGRVFEEEEDYTNAMKCYKKALKINPKHPTVNNNIGELYEKLGEEQKALEYYNKQIEIEPEAYYFVNRAWCYSSLKDNKKAIEDFKNALDYEPDNIYAHNGLGISYKKLKKFKEAIEELKKVSQLDVSNRFVYLYRDMGQCYEGLKDNEEAEKMHTLGIEKFPNNERLYLNRGLFYANIGKHKEAIEDYEHVLKLNPRNSYAYNNIGAVYDDEEDYEKAIKYYKKALEINPEHDKANKNIADIYMDELKDYNTAIKYYKRQIEANFTGAYLYKRISEAYYKSKKYMKAKEYALMALKIYEKELEENPQACTYRYAASCYRYMKKVEQAREFYNKAIECADKCEDCHLKQCHEAYCEIGEIYEEFKNYEKALEYYEKASEIDKESEEYKENIVRVRGKIPLK